MSKLAGYQRKYLRGLAHHLVPVCQVGRGGITDAVFAEVQSALRVHELIKVRLHEPEDKRAMAEELAERCDAELCGLIGHTVILYRPRDEKPTIQMPVRPAR